MIVDETRNITGGESPRTPSNVWMETDETVNIIWALSSEKCLRACARCAFRSTCACASYYPGSYILWFPMILLADSEGSDQTARIRRLIWAFAVRICPAPRLKTFFMLNSAEHEIFSVNKYENANNSWHFHIY